MIRRARGREGERARGREGRQLGQVCTRLIRAFVSLVPSRTYLSPCPSRSSPSRRVWGKLLSQISPPVASIFPAMAAISMTMAVAATRFAAVSARADANLSRNGGVLNVAAPMGGSMAMSMSCAFPEFSLSKRCGMNAAIVARASDLEQGAFGDVAMDEGPVPVPAPVQQGSKLYVGNLPWSCDSTQLAEICQDVGVVEQVEVIYDQESGRSRGFAFVTMASNADAQAVIDALDGTELGGRALKVNYPQSNRDKPRFERSERRAPIGGSRRPDDPNKLFVGNLSWGCDDGALRQLFSDFGKVVEARVVYDRDSGRSRGFGFVTFENEDEVTQAIENLDGADFEGRQLRVNLAGEKPPPRF